MNFLENWVREFEKLFGDLNCLENMRVGQVVMYLKDEADLQWREIELGLALLKDSIRIQLLLP